MRFLTIQRAAVLGLAAALMPAIASAQSVGCSTGRYLSGLCTLINAVVSIVNVAIPLAMALALLAFFWGLVRYLYKRDVAGEKSEARSFMLWGIIALFVMAAVWGIVQFIAVNLGIETSGTFFTPTVQTYNLGSR